MIEFLFVLLLGWPAIIVCAVVCVTGLFRKDYRLITLSGLISIPFCWLLSGFPQQIGSPMFFAPLLLFLAGGAMSRKWDIAAWLLAVPFLLLLLLLLSAALT